jgi:hypothetical protein
MICAANGYNYRIWIDFTGGHEECSSAAVTHLLSYNAMGGVFGLIASGIIIIIGLSLFNRYPAVMAVGLAYSVDQFSKIILEGFFTRSYLLHRFDVVVTVIQLTSWIGFMLYFARVAESPKLRADRSV